jgi:DNA-binding NarL/FixJ family response regulator
MRTKVVVAEGYTMFRQGLIALLKQQQDIEVLGEAKDGREAVKACQELRPDLVIIDVAMKVLNGVDTTRQILSRWKDIKIIAVSMYCDRRLVNEMLEAGASGYVLKDSPFAELAEAVRAVRCGRTFLSPSIEKIVMHDYGTRLRGGSEGLSAREREVLQLLAEGKSTKEIAAILHVSVKTIEVNSQHVREKLDLHSVAELTKWAVREGLTSLDQ